MKRYFHILFAMALMLSLIAQLLADSGECGSNFNSTALPAPTSLHVGVILVQFSDWATNVDARGSHCFIHGEDNHYTCQEFRRHLFSQDVYKSPNTRTHDNEDVFGSMRDFYNENSYGKLNVTGEILNDSTFNTTTGQWVPIWVTISQTKPLRESLGINSQNARELLDLALAANSSLSITGFDRIIMIYAGIESGGTNALTPSTQNPQRFVYQVGEKTGLAYGRTNTVGTFYGIGTHAHEFGHLLGLPDLKRGTARRRGLGEFALMAVGNKGFLNGVHNDPNLGGFHAPDHLCGWSKLSLGWANYEELIEGNLTFPSLEEDDQVCVYFINDSDHSDWDEGEYFVLENRRPTFSNGKRTFDGDMQKNGVLGGLLIFHHKNTTFTLNNLNLKVIEADNGTSNGTGVASSNMSDFYPGTTNNTEFSPTSTPSSDDANGNATVLSLLNIANNNGVVTAIVDFGTPNAPQNLAITNAGQNGQKVNLSWNANSETDIDHYAIYRGYQYSAGGSINWLSNPSGTTANTSWTDPFIKINSSASTFVHYRITAVDLAANESDYSNTVSTGSNQLPKAFRQTGNDESPVLPGAISLHQNYPNPFNPVTAIHFDLPQSANISLKIYNLLGEEIRTLVSGSENAGFHAVSWDGLDDLGNQVSSGVYIYRLEVKGQNADRNSFVESRKLTLLR